LGQMNGIRQLLMSPICMNSIPAPLMGLFKTVAVGFEPTVAKTDGIIYKPFAHRFNSVD
jgi:hypothetical protein